MNGVIDRDRGWKGLERRLKQLNSAHTKVGVQQGTLHEGNEVTSGRSGGITIETSDMVVIAAVQEFGAPKRNIPVRPFMRNAFDKSREKLNRAKKRLYNSVLLDEISPKTAVTKLGEIHKGQIQREIVNLRSPPNAPSTIKRKKSSNPLIDTGQLRQSIHHVEVM